MATTKKGRDSFVLNFLFASPLVSIGLGIILVAATIIFFAQSRPIRNDFRCRLALMTYLPKGEYTVSVNTGAQLVKEDHTFTMSVNTQEKTGYHSGFRIYTTPTDSATAPPLCIYFEDHQLHIGWDLGDPTDPANLFDRSGIYRIGTIAKDITGVYHIQDRYGNEVGEFAPAKPMPD